MCLMSLVYRFLSQIRPGLQNKTQKYLVNKINCFNQPRFGFSPLMSHPDVTTRRKTSWDMWTCDEKPLTDSPERNHAFVQVEFWCAEPGAVLARPPLSSGSRQVYTVSKLVIRPGSDRYFPAVNNNWGKSVELMCPLIASSVHNVNSVTGCYWVAMVSAW